MNIGHLDFVKLNCFVRCQGMEMNTIVFRIVSKTGRALVLVMYEANANWRRPVVTTAPQLHGHSMR